MAFSRISRNRIVFLLIVLLSRKFRGRFLFTTFAAAEYAGTKTREIAVVHISKRAVFFHETVQQRRLVFRRVRRGAIGRVPLPGTADPGIGRGSTGTAWCFSGQKLNGGWYAMKIVIVKSPKMVGGILRKIFGIKKETYIEQ